MGKRKFRKVVEILSRSQPSKFQNYTYHLKLECGHVAIHDYHRGINPREKKVLCRMCSKIDDFDKYR